ncbi:MAG: UDP-N-acetylmuramate dehydrogenase [Thermodesulfobacteriota bacterium]
MTDQQKQELKKLVHGLVIFDAPMRERTTLRIGGPAEALALPSSSAGLSELVGYLSAEEIPYLILGKGSNLLVKDGGIKGVVVDLSTAFSRVWLVEENGADALIEAQAGAQNLKLNKLTMEKGLAGLEFLCGIPGSVGGSLVMNAGTREGEMMDAVDSLTMMDRTGQVKTLPVEDLHFSYRHLQLPPGTIVLAGRFKVCRTDREHLQEKMTRILEHRRNSHPLDMASAGCVFRNPEGQAAGKIIEVLGLKGAMIGGAQVSTMHANFIVNLGNATSSDFLELIDTVREKVYQETGIELAMELMVVGEDASC